MKAIRFGAKENYLGTVKVELKNDESRASIMKNKKNLSHHRNSIMQNLIIKNLKTEDHMAMENFARDLLKMIPGGNDVFMAANGHLRQKGVSYQNFSQLNQQQQRFPSPRPAHPRHTQPHDPRLAPQQPHNVQSTPLRSQQPTPFQSQHHQANVQPTPLRSQVIAQQHTRPHRGFNNRFPIKPHSTFNQICSTKTRTPPISTLSTSSLSQPPPQPSPCSTLLKCSIPLPPLQGQLSTSLRSSSNRPVIMCLNLALAVPRGARVINSKVNLQTRNVIK